MLNKQKRVAIQEQNGKTVFAATESVARSAKGQKPLMDAVEKEVIDAYNN